MRVTMGRERSMASRRSIRSPDSARRSSREFMTSVTTPISAYGTNAGG